MHTTVTVGTHELHQTVAPPTTVLLLAEIAIDLKTWRIAFLCLNFPDEIGFSQFLSFNTHLFGFFPHIRHFHGRPSMVLLFFSEYLTKLRLAFW